ncbi:MAG: hypothetical protein ACYC18_11375 [Gammaproteobacteria bacterium]
MTRGRGTYERTGAVQRIVVNSGVRTGICWEHRTVPHGRHVTVTVSGE